MISAATPVVSAADYQVETDPSDAVPVVPYLVPVPDSLPPFDDERTARTRLRALAATSPAGRAVIASLMRPAAARVAIADDSVPSWSEESDVGVRRTRSMSLPEAERVGRSLARALVEVLAGRRSLGQLRPLCAPDVYAGLSKQPIGFATTAQLTSVRVCEPADGAAEVAAVVRIGRRAHAIAFRIQGLDGRWRMTALQTA